MTDDDEPTNRSREELTTPDTAPVRDPGELADSAAATMAALHERGTIGRFTVLDVLGAGGMGVVLAAYDPQLDRKVAIKILRTRGLSGARREKEAARLLREARAIAQLSHPHVITVYDAGTIDERVFIAMEYIPGKTARAWLTDERRSVDEILDVYIKAGRGLAAGHHAGMVHRDFKPDNVLVGNDGRVCVIDFGLAQPARQTGEDEGEKTPPPTWSEIHTESLLTTAGLLFGTPAYMSPEQHRKAELDARADQFSFCAALFEALYKRMPFKANTYPELAQKVHDGKIDMPDENPAIPGRVTAAVLRGLRPHPDDRFPTMDALLDALLPPARRRRGIVIASMAVGAAAAVGITLGVTRMREDPAAACRGGEARLAGVWDGAVRQRVRGGLLATKRHHAPETAERVTAELDRYAADWVARRQDVCEATAVRHEQSAEALDRRMQCFARDLSELGALTRVFATADAATADGAITAARNLPRPAACVTLDASNRPAPAQQPMVDAAERELAELHAQRAARKPRAEIERLQKLLPRVRGIGYAPLEAKVVLELGTSFSIAGRAEDADRTLRDALAIAARAKDDTTMAWAETLLVWVVGHQLAHYKDALAILPLAEATLDRVDADTELRSELRYHVGATHFTNGNYQLATEAYRAAVELRRKAFGDSDPGLFNLLNSLGGSLLKQGAVFPAKATFDKALALGDRTLGPNHPDVARTLANVGGLAQAFGNFDEATRLLQRALPILEETLGPEHLDVGLVLYSLGVSANGREDYKGALPYYQRALAIFEKLGPEHPQVGLALVGVADCLEEVGRAAEGVPPGERALAIVSKTSADPVQLAMARFILAKALWAAGRDHPRARALATEARKGFVEGGLAAIAGTNAVDKFLAKTKDQP